MLTETLPRQRGTSCPGSIILLFSLRGSKVRGSSDFKRTSSRVSIWTNTGEVIMKLAAGRKENLVRYLYGIGISHGPWQKKILNKVFTFSWTKHGQPFPECLKCFSGNRKYCSVIPFTMLFVLLMFFTYKHTTLRSFLEHSPPSHSSWTLWKPKNLWLTESSVSHTIQPPANTVHWSFYATWQQDACTVYKHHLKYWEAFICTKSDVDIKHR